MTRPAIMPHDAVAVRVIGQGAFFEPLVHRSIDSFIAALLIGVYSVLEVSLRNGQRVTVKRRWNV